ncbi:hypothetical protein Y1Q_0010861 [Alligator mississippiensis]|uniref:Uncharacterized protein n=1 Tax=Alligator mississippiensis TaxID=8496 RepID=A0A151M722_ALLMI|nr:hypothetical protein Y1Q_0010861 [Alligator mississippiensis]
MRGSWNSKEVPILEKCGERMLGCRHKGGFTIFLKKKREKQEWKYDLKFPTGQSQSTGLRIHQYCKYIYKSVQIQLCEDQYKIGPY